MKMTTIDKVVNDRFEDFIFDWDYKQYLLVGGYGSSKSYHVVCKIIFKCLSETRKVLVIRNVYDTIRESCYDLFCEILEELDLLSDNRKAKGKVVSSVSPMTLSFPNGSKIIFKGMDKPQKLKSINGISIIWIEECSEIKYSGYKELLGRLRHPTKSLHIIMSTNPVGTENWVYEHFFKRVNSKGEEFIVLDDNRLYEKKTIIKNGVYYHHSTADDNKFLPASYLKTLDELQEYDEDLYRIARLGRFGLNGIRVLPQFSTMTHKEVMKIVQGIPQGFRFKGMDFGFETSYNAVISMAVDDVNKDLYIYQEYYKNHMTDVETADELDEQGYKDGTMIIADSEDPKAIKFYQQSGFRMRGCKKYAGSRLANTRKVKRFRHIYCSDACKNTIRELATLTYLKDGKDKLIYDQFNIDPHTFSAIWYGLDNYHVADVKTITRNSRKGTD